MSYYNESGIRTLTASGPIAKYLRVHEVGGEVFVSSDSDYDIGTANRPAFAKGDPIPVRDRNMQGSCIMIADGPIPSGFQVFAALNGKVSQAGTALIGIAFSEATADGDEISVMRVEGGSGGGSGITLAQVRQQAVVRTGTAPFASIAAANAALGGAVPTGEIRLATTTTGQLLIAYGGASAFTAYGGTGGDIAAAPVANLAARPAVAGQPEGFRVTTTSNGLTWIVVDGAYVVEDLETTVATIAARDALTERQTNQRVFVNADNTTYRWDGAAWQSQTSDGADVVANLAARPAVATRADGYRVQTTSNGLTWIVVNGAYVIEHLQQSVATIAARNALTEQQAGQLVYVNADDTLYRWDGAAWQTRPAGTTDYANAVANIAARDAIATPLDGLSVLVNTNGLVYQRIDGAWRIQSMFGTAANAAARTALSELVTGQRVTDLDTNTTFRWNGTAWVNVAAAADLADIVVSLAARPAVAGQTDGYRVRVQTNNLMYVVVDGAYRVDNMTSYVADATARDVLTEQVTGQIVITEDNGRAFRWNGTTWAELYVSEGTRFDLTAIPTLAQLPNPGDQAVIMQGDLEGMVFENVAGTITYRRQLGMPRRTITYNTVALRNAVAAALLTGNAPGLTFDYFLTTTVGADTPGIYRITSFAGPNGLQTNVVNFGGGGGGGATNLGYTAAAGNGVVTSDTGNDATIPLADATNAGLLQPGIIHPNSPAANLPLTAQNIGQIFIRNGATNPGMYVALDTVGNWSGPK